jgi:hypothetical protein
MVMTGPWLVGFTTAANIGQNDGEFVCQLWRDLMPTNMRLRISVQHEQRRTGTGDQSSNRSFLNGYHHTFETWQKSVVHVICIRIFFTIHFQSSFRTLDTGILLHNAALHPPGGELRQTLKK